MDHPRSPQAPKGVTLSTVTCAFAGALVLSASYALARRGRLTQVDLAARLVPGRPVAGRAAQVVAGTGACLPAAWLGTPTRGLLAGAAAGAVAQTTVEGRSDRALAVATHALAGLVAGLVRRAARGRRAAG
jgi:hypothetical protein